MDHYSKYKLVCDISRHWILLIFVSFYGPWITILAPFGGPWDHFGTILVIKWGTDAFNGTLEGPRMDFE